MFLTSLPLDTITLNPTNKKTDQSISDFQIGIGATAHATLYTEQLASDTRTVIIDTIASLQVYDGEVIPFSEVHKFLTNIHEILDNSVSKQVSIELVF